MREPFFWKAGLDPKSREAAPLTRVLLTPLAYIYGAVTAWKITHAKPLKVPAYVICVGNITAGGVGKSPIVAALRERLSQLTSARVATLSRGYGGRLKGPVEVNFNTHTAQQVGDEPLMLSGHGESWIGANRALAGQEMSVAGVDIIVMDDGHQNPSLLKDITFVVIDSNAPFGNGHIIPKGPLRERPAESLERADAVILMGNGPTPKPVVDSELPVIRASIEPVSTLPKQPYVAFAGIGRPEKFFDTLQSLGVEPRDCIPFADHHVYSGSDMSYLRGLAQDHEAVLVTTEKDYARLSNDQRSGVLTLPIQAQFDDTALLDKVLSDVMKPVST